MKKLVVFAGLMSCLMLAFSVQAQGEPHRIPCERGRMACDLAKQMEEQFKSSNTLMNEQEQKEFRELKRECRESRILPK